MKKTLALILCALMLSQTLLSCSENTANSDTKDTSSGASGSAAAETNPEETQLSDNLGEHDFEGSTFRAVSAHEPFLDKIVVDDYTGTPVVDAIRKGIITTEDRFNTKIEKLVESGDMQASIKAGDNTYSIIIGYDFAMDDLVMGGMLWNLYEIEQFDFTQPWWPKNITKALDMNGRVYIGANSLCYEGIACTRVPIVNKDLAEEFNLEIPYDMVREGTWTFDAMLSYVSLSMDADGNGTIDALAGNDIIGYIGGTHYTMQECFGVTPYQRDAEGNLIFNIDMDRMEGYVNKMLDFTKTDAYLTGERDWDGEKVFIDGRALVAYMQIDAAYTTYSNGDFRYGFLTTPKYDELQEEYVNCCTDAPWGIPISIRDEELDKVGVICEALSCYNHQNVMPVYFDVTMKNRIADSPDDAEMLQLIADTRTISFGYTFFLPLSNIVYELIDTNQGVASYAASKSKSAEKALKSLIKSIDKMEERRK